MTTDDGGYRSKAGNRSEYEALIARLAPRLGGVSAANLSEEDIERVARQSRADRGQMESLRIASSLAPRLGYAVEVLYGIDRLDPGLSAERLAAMPERRRRDLLSRAIDENIAPPTLRGHIHGAVRPTPPAGDGTAPLAPSVEAPAAEYLSSPTRIADLGRAGLRMPRAVQTTLRERGFETLADIRAAGGLGELDGVSPQLRRTIEAHIDLDRVSPDATTNASLIERGYDSVEAISRDSLYSFVAATSEGTTALEAATLHSRAVAQESTLENILSGIRVDMANRIATPADIASRPFAAYVAGNDPPCDCSDCKAASSPIAYLADLLDYAIEHLRSAGSSISLDYLTNTFHQPFGDLPTDCDAIEERVRQARIAVEVLRRHLKLLAIPPAKLTALDADESAYRRAAYGAVLEQVGTSDLEIRLAHSGAPIERSALAARLGIPIDPLGLSRPDALDALLLDSAMTAGPAAQIERNLERLFGLVDTTRDPLSQGIVENDPSGQIRRWKLQGALWRYNTADDGLIHVNLIKQPSGLIKVELFADEARTRLVASAAAVAPKGAATLASANDSGLSGEMHLDYTADHTSLAISILPKLVASRLVELRNGWTTQDRPQAGYEVGPTLAALAELPAGVVFPASLGTAIAYDVAGGALRLDVIMNNAELEDLLSQSSDPAYQIAVRQLYRGSQRKLVVDPDLIGPDDMRRPEPKGAPGDPDGPMDVWLRRRAWIDDRLADLRALTTAVHGVTAPDPEQMLTSMYTAVAYEATTVGWPASTPLADLDTLAENLTNGGDVVATPQLRVETDLGLTPEALFRMQEVRLKHAAWAFDVRETPPAASDYEALISLLVQALKVRLGPAWRFEEVGLTFDASSFWPSLTEPQTGAWPPVLEASEPLIDQELTPLSGLPDGPVGDKARAFWQARQTALATELEALRTLTQPDRFNKMLRHALGDPSPGNPLPDNPETVLDATVDPNPLVADAAEATVRTSFFMSLAEFRRVMAIKEKDESPSPRSRPTPQELDEARHLLLSAAKRKRLLAAWVAEETAAGTGVQYWQARKACLPQWRAAASARADWQAAVRATLASPLIDPDLIGPADLRLPKPAEPAYDLWKKRSDHVTTLLAAIKAMRVGSATPALGVDAIIAASLKESATSIEAVGGGWDRGEDVARRLEQLGLSQEAFLMLRRVQRLAHAGGAVLDDEWKAVYSILAQVEKTYDYNLWRSEEAAASVLLAPEFFVLPSAPAADAMQSEPLPLPEWRATWQQRRAWQDALQARYDQQQSIIDGVAAASSAAEGLTITRLRDALIMASDATTADLAGKATWLTKRLLIDAADGECMFTTRVEQAIETIQDLLFSVRTGQILGALALTLDAPHFDPEWEWMGSYGTWKPAILTFMYPENVLLPSLKRPQTSAFTQLVDSLRSAGRVTRETVCRAAHAYAGYFEDICTLKVTASARVWSREVIGENCSAHTSPNYRWVWYYMGIGEKTGTLYWTWWAEGDTSPYAAAFWRPVPGYAGPQIGHVCGARSFWTSAAKRYMYLFVVLRERGVDQLVFSRYDPDTNIWDAQPTVLPMRPEWPFFSVYIAPWKSGDGDPPRIGVKLPNDKRWSRRLARDGSGWAQADWTPVNEWQPWRKLPDTPTGMRPVTPVAGQWPEHLDIFWVAPDGGVDSMYWDADQNDGQWGHPFRIGPGFNMGLGHLTAIARRPGHLALFGIGNDGAVYTNWWDAGADNGQWHAWAQIGPPGLTYQKGDVTVVQLNPQRMDAFVVDRTGHVQWSWLENTPGNDFWHPWAVVGSSGDTTYADHVGAAARKPNHVDVFIIDTTGRVRHNWMEAPNLGVWQPVWESTDNGFRSETSMIAAISRRDGEVSVFAGGKTDGYGQTNLYENHLMYWGSASGWSGFKAAGPDRVITHSFIAWMRITPLSRFQEQIDLFTGTMDIPTTRGRVSSTWWYQYDGTGYHGWFPIGDPNTQAYPNVGAEARVPERIDLFTGGFDGIMTTFFQGMDWNENAKPVLPPFALTPNVKAPFDILETLTAAELQTQRTQIRKAYLDNATAPASVLSYLDEAFYLVRVFLALQLQQNREFVAALDWFRTVYDYSVPPVNRTIWYGFEREVAYPVVFTRTPEWLLDPLNPHAIAAARRFAHTRFTVLSIVRCLLVFADAEFTIDTGEALTKTRTLCLTALGLLELDIFRPSTDPCERLWIDLSTIYVAPEWKGHWLDILKDFSFKWKGSTLAQVSAALTQAMSKEEPWERRLGKARGIVTQASAGERVAPTISQIMEQQASLRGQARTAALAEPSTHVALAAAAEHTAAATVALAVSLSRTDRFEAADAALTSFTEARSIDLARYVRPPGIELPTTAHTLSGHFNEEAREILLPWKYIDEIAAKGPPRKVPGPSYEFCIPPNPLLKSLRMHAELTLFKLRHCMNIAGMYRDMEPYSAPIDVASGLPTTAGDRLILPGLAPITPTPYRYQTLIERAKQLADLAAQIESAMLSAIVQGAEAAYTEMKAAQDVQLARARVRLQDLRVVEAEGEITLAQLQQDRARIQVDHWQGQLQHPISEQEQNALSFLEISAALHGAAAAASAVASPLSLIPPANPSGAASNLASSLSSLAQVSATTSQVLTTMASYERRQQDWELNQAVAQQDELIGRRSVLNAFNRLHVTEQDRAISTLEADYAQDTLTYLSNRFPNAEMFEWMGNVLQGVFAFFLQNATVIANLAQQQVAFERQEPPPAVIQTDYWAAPPPAGQAGSPDRRGLTGSARLLQDIYRLDQYAFLTDSRKHQLAKTISLAQMDPYEFQRLRETGVMHFATPMELFDRDFPGHYLRLIKRVSLSVIALIPPTQGIRATLSTTGTSRVTVGGELFRTTILRREPQSVALSLATGGGVFDPDPQAELLLPFEGIGVDTTWQFTMPQASNPFDSASLADVLLTMDYTAFDSFDYRQQVIASLPSRRSASRAYSFRYELSDAWYDLHNPDQTAAPMTVRFQTSRRDLLANLQDITVQQVSLYAACSGARLEIPSVALRLRPMGGSGQVGGVAAMANGLISTRAGNGAAWASLIGKAPFGEWELTLPNTAQLRRMFTDNEIDDLMLVVTYKASSPAWPA